VLVAIGVVLFDEYRLEVNGLLFGLPAIGLLSLSKTLLLQTSDFRRAAGSGPSAQSRQNPLARCVLLFPSVALAITVSFAYIIENNGKAMQDLRRISPLLLTLNMASVLLTIVVSSTTAFSIENSEIGTHQHFAGTNAAGAFLFAGLAALSSTFFTKPTYLTSLQILVSAGAFVLLTVAFHSHQTPTNYTVVDEAHVQDNMHSESSRSSSDFNKSMSASDESLLPNDLENLPGFREDDLSYAQRPPSSTLLSTSRLPLAIVIWTLFAILNFQHVQPTDDRSILDMAYKSRSDFDVVINMFDEKPSAVGNMVSQLRALPNFPKGSTRVFVYIKDPTADVDLLRAQIGATDVIQRPNIGREGETYLHHITTNWDDLAKHTLFLQAHVHNSWQLFRRIRHYFVPETGMLSLGFSGHTCDCMDCRDRWGWEDNNSFVSQTFLEVYNRTCATALLSYKGQFIASARRIRGIDRKIYERLGDAMVDPNSWAHKEPYLKGRNDSLDAPVFGYLVERLWSILLQCSDLQVAANCPSLISGTRRDGDLGDCQCFDKPG
jgi:hypothetical protein